MLNEINEIYNGLSLHYTKVLCKFCLSKKNGVCDLFVDNHPCSFCYSFAEKLAEETILNTLCKGGDLVDIDY